MKSLYRLVQLIIQTRNQKVIIGWRAKIALNLCKSLIVNVIDQAQPPGIFIYNSDTGINF